jgi:hypothetical protein
MKMNSNNKKLSTIEQNHIGHFVYLPKILGFDVHRANDDLRGLGYGTDMMLFLMKFAKDHGRKSGCAMATRCHDELSGCQSIL